MGDGELGRAAEAAPDRVEIRSQLAEGLVQGRRGQPVGPPGPAWNRRPFERGRDLVGRTEDVRPLRAPGLVDEGQDLEEPGPPPAPGPAESRSRRRTLLVGRHHDRQRPAARAGQLLADGHEMLVEIGPFLAVDLDRDEVRVEEPGHRPRRRRTPAPSRGTSGRSNSRRTGRPAGLRAGRGRRPPRPTDTSPRGCGRAAGGRGSFPGPGGWWMSFPQAATSSRARGRSFPGSWRGC